MSTDVELVPLALHIILTDPSAPWADVRIHAQAWHVARSVYGSKDEDDEKRIYRALQAAAYASPKPADPAAELQARVAELEAEVDRLTVERDEALRGPWEDWATRILTCVRAHSGDKGEGDAEGIDLPAEVQECLNVLAHEAEPMAKIGPAAVRAGYRGDVAVADFVCTKLAPRKRITLSLTSEAFTDVLRIENNAVFSTPNGGFIIRSHPELGAYPDSYRHAVMALARQAGIQLADDHGQALRCIPFAAVAPVNIW